MFLSIAVYSDPSRPAEVPVTFFMKYQTLPAELTGEATATYQNTAGTKPSKYGREVSC